MSTPAEVVEEAFSQAQTYINNAEAHLATSVAAMNAAVQAAPLIDVTFEAIAGPSAGSAPTTSLSAPTFTPPADYSGGLLSTLASVLTTRLAGGTGLATAVETAIWDRARDREAAIAQANMDDLQRTGEGMGFMLPTGYIAAQLRQEQRNYYDKTSGLSRDVAMKQAELEQSNMQHAIEKATAYEDALASIIQRRTGLIVDEYRAKTEGYRAEVEVFRAEIEAYSAQVSSDIKHWEVEVKQYEATQNYVLNAQKMNTEITRANLATVLEAAKTSAQMYAQLAAAGYSLINASASVSAGATNSVSYSYGNDTSNQPVAVTAV